VKSLAPTPQTLTLALSENGPLIRQRGLSRKVGVPLVLLASFLAGWGLSLLERGVLGAVTLVDAAALGLGAVALAAVTASELRRTRDLRAFTRRPLRTSVRSVSPGQRVRVRGRVLPGPEPPRSGSSWDAVLARYVGRITSFSGGLFSSASRSVEELRGQSFRLALDEGESVAVEVDNALLVSEDSLMERSRLASRPLWSRLEDPESGLVVFVHDEERVRPGDEVEIVGTVEPTVDPQGEAPGYRGARVGVVLRGSAVRPLLVRRV
jgi:hypothetical protein